MFNTTHLLGIALKKNNDSIVTLNENVTQNTTDITAIKNDYVKSTTYTAAINEINGNISTLNGKVTQNTTDIASIKTDYVKSATYTEGISDINTKIGTLDVANLNEADKSSITSSTSLWDAIEHLSKNKVVIDVTADISAYSNDELTFTDKSVTGASTDSFNVYTSSKVNSLVNDAKSTLNTTISGVSDRVAQLEQDKNTEDKTIVVDIIYDNESLIYNSSEALTIDSSLSGYTINVLRENAIKAEASLDTGKTYILSNGTYTEANSSSYTVQHIWIKTNENKTNTDSIVYHCV